MKVFALAVLKLNQLDKEQIENLDDDKLYCFEIFE